MAQTAKVQDLDRQTVFWIDEWRVEPASSRLIRGEQEIKLEPRVMDLLLCLAARPGEVITRETLEDTVWAGMVVGYDALTSAMIKLRKAFADDSRHPQIIETVAKRGYRLIATVSHTNPASQANDAATTVCETKSEPATRRRLPIFLGATIGGLVVIAIISIVLSIGQETASTNPVATREPAQAALVVLPFVNLSDDPAQEYFSDGITEDLIVDLSRFSGLFVISTRTAFIYKRQSVDIQKLAKDLDVGYVVEGSVRRTGNQLRINVQLVDATTGINLWAQRFDRLTEDVFSVQDEMRRNIINALSITLTEEERKREQRRFTHSFEAYDLFLQGQAKLVTRASAMDSKEAQMLMEQAIEIDPDFARAYAALALIHADAYRFDWSEDHEQTRQEALQIGKRAIELDNQSPQAHWILGYIYLFLFEDHDKAIEMANKSIDLAPYDMDAALVLAVTYAFGDDPAKAALIAQDIMQHNPRYSALVPSVLGLANFRLQKYSESLAAYDKSLLINPSRIQGNVYKAVVLYRMGNSIDAEFQVDQLYTLHPDFDVHVWAARQPFKDKSIVKQMVDDLRHAGVR